MSTKTVLMVFLLFMAAMMLGCKEKQAEATTGYIEADTGGAEILVGNWPDDIVRDIVRGVGDTPDGPGVDFTWESDPNEVKENLDGFYRAYQRLKNEDFAEKVGLIYNATADSFDEPDAPPVWGKGELPADHQGFFGDSNTARLNYVQNMVLDKHAAILEILAVRVLALEAVDPNAMRLDALESEIEKLTWVEPETPVVEAVE